MAGVGALMVDIGARKSVGFSILGIIDLTQLAQVACVFLCLPLVFLRESHIAVDFVTEKLPARLRALVELVSALLGIAEYLEVLGRDRIANLVRTVTFNVEQTVNDLRHDLLHLPRRNKPKVAMRRVRRKRASDVVARRVTALTPRPKPVTPSAASARISPRVLT